MSSPPVANWYVGRQGQQSGPFRWDELQGQAAHGALSAGDLVWCDGMADWALAATIPGLLHPGATAADSSDSGPSLLHYRPSTDIVYAGFWQRVAAAVIDGVLLWIVQFGVAFALGFTLARSQLPQATDIAEALASLLGLVLGWLYEALMVASPRQATLGKMALGIVVVGPDGGRLGFGRATGRHFSKIISGIILGIGYLMMLWSERKQTLHDLIASAYVIRRRP